MVIRHASGIMRTLSRIAKETGPLCVLDATYAHRMECLFVVDGAAARPEQDQSSFREELLIFRSGGDVSSLWR